MVPAVWICKVSVTAADRPVVVEPTKLSEGEPAEPAGKRKLPVMVEPDSETLPEAVPVKLAVIVVALKLPEASLETMAEKVLALVAVVALLLTLPAALMTCKLLFVTVLTSISEPTIKELVTKPVVCAACNTPELVT